MNTQMIESMNTLELAELQDLSSSLNNSATKSMKVCVNVIKSLNPSMAAVLVQLPTSVEKIAIKFMQWVCENAPQEMERAILVCESSKLYTEAAKLSRECTYAIDRNFG